LKNFETEEYFAKYDYKAPHFVCVSDCESVNIAELISLGGGSIEDFLKTQLVYPAMLGGEDLRKEISTLYKNVNEKQVLVLGAPIEGIFLTLNAFLRQGDHVVVLSPAYDALFNVAEQVTGNVSRWYLKQNNGSWSLDFDQLEDLLKKNTKLLVFNFPHNPTGFLPTQSEFLKLIELAKKYGTWVLSDEMYRGLEYASDEKLPSACELTDNAIVLSGASKSLGLAGLRLGWLIVKNPELYQKIFQFKNYTSMCATQAGEYLGKMAVRATPKLVERNLKIIESNLKITEQFFKKWSQRFEWIPPKAGSVSVVKLKDIPAEKFCHEIAEKYGVVLLPIRFMGYEDAYFRLGYGRSDFSPGMKALDLALENYFGKVSSIN
jgi:aspartate/methionine/tyrosine aminotransferase